MKRFVSSLVALAVPASSAFAAQAPSQDGGNFLLVLFLAFLAMILWFQFLPALKHFTEMLKGLGEHEQKKSEKHVNS